MNERIEADICVIGGGSGGLTVAAGASQMGASVVLIERGEMGGDCLNYGCVPSKALLSSAKAAYRRHGLTPEEGAARAEFGNAMRHVQSAIAAIQPMDSVERYEGLGVRVIAESARFTGPTSIVAGDYRIDARRFVVATGSRAGLPPIPGLDTVPYLTNETLFRNTVLPTHLIVVGAGPIGLEMAQAHRRLGARVTVLEAYRALAKDDRELAAIVIDRLRGEGIEIVEGAEITGVKSRDGIVVTLAGKGGGDPREIRGSHLLVAAGRRPNVDGLDLEKAGIEYDKGGISVDRRMRTTNRKVFAVGDVAGGPQFTHVAGYQAGIVIRNALFRLPAKVDYAALPWVTFTDPELAQVGLAEDAARERHGRISILRWPYAENDRAQTEGLTDGLIKVIVGRRGRILGASIVGAQAGELIQPWGLAIANGLKIGAMAGAMVAYPTLGEISKRAAGSYYTPSLFSNRTRALVRFLARFG
ncbi:dihydrolipoyl dehydrogenase family protein [Oceanibacterium hippocampi]|uniref:Dihydrolipoyl dehydrogenase n=1 Tax=Oceanibacterium hippocampi TaxID=745714 RepID=A0A1Y5RVV5_9PROT|nr:FAD-dependent oxidoreductase [Oceanibacterium hippocampi]SLN25375.1 Dihydrolipoyl dehydrogenase [Oceanibacterium hippocampi]